MATNPDRWYFTREQLRNNPTIKCGVDPEKELSYRQQAANLIQDMGQRLQVYQLCINTAIVYMHRFYMIHSFTKFPRNSIAAAALFLAAKVEEQPHKLEHVIRVAHACLHRGEPPLDARSNAYLQQSQELVINESIVLQTLGFEVGVVHPHTHVVKCTQMIRASKDLSQSSYFLATNSLHLTTFSLQYKPTVVACVCIHLACKWTQWDIPKSNDGKQWWEYVDPTVTEELLDDLTREFLIIIDKCPTRLKKRIMAVKGNTSSKGRQQRNDATSNSDSTNQQSSRPGPSSSLGSVDSGLTDGASHDAFDYSFDSKASGFDQFSDFDQDQPAKTDVSFQQKVEKSAAKDTSSNPSPAPSVPRQGLPEAPRKPEPVRVSYEEYKRKERERKERELQMKKEQQIPSSNAGDKTDNVNFAHVRPVQKESKHQGYDKVPAGNPALTKEKIQATHMKNPSSHDRKPHGPDRKPSGHERKLAGPDRNLSGHERVTSSHDRISSGHEKVSSGYTRPPGHERIPSAQGVKPDKSQSSVDIPKRPPHDERRDKRESKPPELQSVSHPGVIGVETNPGSGTSVRTSAGSVVDMHVKKERAERRHEQSVESRGKSSKPQSSEHRKHRSQHHNPHHKGGDGSTGERTIKPVAAPQPSSTQDIPMFKQEPVETELAKQETLDMLSQLRDEVIKDLEKESTSAKNTSETYKPLSGPDSLKSEPVGGKVVPRVQPPPVTPEIALPVGVNDSKPVEKSFIKLAKEDKSTDKRVEQVDSPKVESRKEHSSRKRDHSEKREDHEKRREGHRSRKEERRHKSHKHRHSPSVKSTGENDLAGGSGEMAPAKKLKLENADSRDSAPHTVLTTSQGIRLKIKGLSNSFNNGNDHSNGKQESEKAGNSNSPSSISLKLNLTRLNSSHTVSSPGESSQEQEHSNHRSHHKHKSRSHHRSKEGHHKRSRSPATSSASERDGSPAVSSPAKRKTPESVQATKSGIPNNQSLLRLPMPPGDPAKSSSHRHSSPGGKHSKHKRGTPPVRPPLPDEDVPPPPPPLPHYPQHAPLSTVTALPPMQYSTIDPSALYGSYQPPLPKEKHVNKRPPPPPPPLPPPETRPPLPP